MLYYYCTVAVATLSSGDSISTSFVLVTSSVVSLLKVIVYLLVVVENSMTVPSHTL